MTPARHRSRRPGRTDLGACGASTDGGLLLVLGLPLDVLTHAAAVLILESRPERAGAHLPSIVSVVPAFRLRETISVFKWK